MVGPMDHRILDLLIQYGPIVLFAAQMFGIFGLPIPDELLMTVAGALIWHGRLQPVPTVLAALGGCMTGITLSYVLGRTVGPSVTRRFVRFSDIAFDRAQRWFKRFGSPLLTFGYFIPGVRHCTAIAAGITPISYRRFAAFAYTGSVLWCSTFIGLWYLAGDRWPAVFEKAKHVAPIAAIPVAIVAVTILYLRSRRRRSRPL